MPATSKAFFLECITVKLSLYDQLCYQVWKVHHNFNQFLAIFLCYLPDGRTVYALESWPWYYWPKPGYSHCPTSPTISSILVNSIALLIPRNSIISSLLISNGFRFFIFFLVKSISLDDNVTDNVSCKKQKQGFY